MPTLFVSICTWYKLSLYTLDQEVVCANTALSAVTHSIVAKGIPHPDTLANTYGFACFLGGNYYITHIFAHLGQPLRYEFSSGIGNKNHFRFRFR